MTNKKTVNPYTNGKCMSPPALGGCPCMPDPTPAPGVSHSAPPALLGLRAPGQDGVGHEFCLCRAWQSTNPADGIPVLGPGGFCVGQGTWQEGDVLCWPCAVLMWWWVSWWEGSAWFGGWREGDQQECLCCRTSQYQNTFLVRDHLPCLPSTIR